jgi:uncharacterized membrane protein
MTFILPFIVVGVAWLIGRLWVTRWAGSERSLLWGGRIAVGLLGALLLLYYLYLKFFDGNFQQNFYFPLMGIISFRISMAFYSLFREVKSDTKGQQAESAPTDEIMSRALLIIVFSLILIWFFIGYFFPGALGSLPIVS